MNYSGPTLRYRRPDPPDHSCERVVAGRAKRYVLLTLMLPLAVAFKGVADADDMVWKPVFWRGSYETEGAGA